MKKAAVSILWIAMGVWQAWPADAPRRIQAFRVDFNWGEGGPNGFAAPGPWPARAPSS
jgi:hypothetical protein